MSGDNVFSGTFDGQGHLISNLTMEVKEDFTGKTNYAQIGLFSVVASASEADYASVKNLVFANVDITVDITGGLAAAGTLAGEVNGYAAIENIAVLDGSIKVNGSNQCDTVGAGGLNWGMPYKRVDGQQLYYCEEYLQWRGDSCRKFYC